MSETFRGELTIICLNKEKYDALLKLVIAFGGEVKEEERKVETRLEAGLACIFG